MIAPRHFSIPQKTVTMTTCATVLIPSSTTTSASSVPCCNVGHASPGVCAPRANDEKQFGGRSLENMELWTHPIHVRTGPPVGVGIGSLPVTPNTNGEIGVLCVESDLA